MQSKETIITKCYDYLKYLIPLLSKLPRDIKFSLGSRIQDYSTDILELLITAYYSKEKFKYLAQANTKIEIIRMEVRLLYELKYINLARQENLNRHLHEIGAMTGGWIKSLKR